jgi:N-methylhydantoinase B
MNDIAAPAGRKGEGRYVGNIGPIELEIIRHRLEAINADACDTLVRVSGSQIASEANDLNTSLMTADGTVLVAGKYTMVLSTSLNFVVADILSRYQDNPGIRPGDQFITNDPYVGTNHQPDVVVVAPIFAGDRLIAWTGSVCHQADIGGPVAGGFNYMARTIWDEAVPMAPMKVVEAGVMRRDIEREYISRSRTPELNALDLLGQIAANRATTERILELCERYGADGMVGAMQRLVDGAEASFRKRLLELPDGVWRNNAYIEQAGLVDGEILPNQVHAVRLTMRKQGSELEFDFTASSDQAPGPINASHSALVNFTMAAVLCYLCQGLAWVPGAVLRAIHIRTRPGSIVAPKWPAAVAMAVASTTQAVRISANACIAAMLDASENHAYRSMASTQGTGSGAAMSGLDGNGRVFSTLLMLELAGGGGAYAGADGADSSGTLSSPGAQTSNVEVDEAYYPVLYRAKRELADSGGPGQRRGGVGTFFAFGPHRTNAPYSLAPLGGGMQHPSAIGVAGGEPGMQGAALVASVADLGTQGNWDRIASRADIRTPVVGQKVAGDHVYAFSAQGGGGYGDPLDRAADDVLEDVLEGLVSEAGARRDYGVVVRAANNPDGMEVDDAATVALRLALRTGRLAGRDPLAREHQRGGRRLSSHFEVRGAAGQRGDVLCSHCGTRICAEGEGLYQHLTMREVGAGARFVMGDRYEGSDRFRLRHFFCPGCATQVDVQIALTDEPVWENMETLVQDSVESGGPGRSA